MFAHEPTIPADPVNLMYTRELEPCCAWSRRDDVPEDLMRESGISLYPVSIEWEPPFTMLTTLRGAGDEQVRKLCLVSRLADHLTLEQNLVAAM